MKLRKDYLIVGTLIVLIGLISLLKIDAIKSIAFFQAPTLTPTPAPTRTQTGTPSPTATTTATVTLTPTCTLVPPATQTRIPTSSLLTPTVLTPSSISMNTPIVIYAAGDIAECDSGVPDKSTGAMITSKLLLKTSGPIFTLGDDSNDSGTKKDYDNCYNPTWGRLLDRTYPVMGNHDASPDNQGNAYFSYFAGMTGEFGHYSLDLGSWHIIVLNAECGIGNQGCYYGSPQEKWLRADLAATQQKCIMALWHQPLFTSGGQSPDPDVRSFWFDLYNYKADIILNGHNHMYERFVPLNPFGVAIGNGISEFVVGTGGAPREYNMKPLAAGEVVHDASSFGFLKLTLLQNSYQWQFIAQPDKSFTDSGTAFCHR
jgi:hypothetical protein